MPLLPGINTDGTAKMTAVGLADTNRASPATLNSLHFLDRQGDSLVTTDNPWGERLFGYEEMSMPGWEGNVINPTATDNFVGWAQPIVVGRTPIPRDVVIYSNPNESAHDALFTAGLNERFVLRHIMAPPKMHLLHTLDLVQTVSGGAMTQQQGWRDTVQMVPYLPPVRVSGAYYESKGFARPQGNSPLAIEMSLIDGSRTFGDASPPSTMTLNISSAGTESISGGGSFSKLSDSQFRAALYVPGIGYEFSGLITGGTSVALQSLRWPGDGAVGLALRAKGGLVHLAFWEYPAEREALG